MAYSYAMKSTDLWNVNVSYDVYHMKIALKCNEMFYLWNCHEVRPIKKSYEYYMNFHWQMQVLNHAIPLFKWHEKGMKLWLVINFFIVFNLEKVMKFKLLNFFIVFNHEKAMKFKLVVNFFIVFNHEKAMKFKLVVNYFIVFNHEKAMKFKLAANFFIVFNMKKLWNSNWW